LYIKAALLRGAAGRLQCRPQP